LLRRLDAAYPVPVPGDRTRFSTRAKPPAYRLAAPFQPVKPERRRSRNSPLPELEHWRVIVRSALRKRPLTGSFAGVSWTRRWPRASLPAAASSTSEGAASSIRKMKSNLQIVDRRPAPSLLPILRSQQQGEILALLLGDPDVELSLTEIARRTGAPHPSVFREVQRAERAGLLTTRKVGNTRLVRADATSPYYAGLADVLTRAFGVPAVLTEALRPVEGIAEAYIYGSWAARHAGQPGQRPVGDIDVLVLGEPDRDQLFEALSEAERHLGRPVEATIRDAAWLDSGTGSFHETVISRPLLRLALPGN
jgi:DNA-binding transcriptional ArsR family regulator